MRRFYGFQTITNIKDRKEIKKVILFSICNLFVTRPIYRANIGAKLRTDSGGFTPKAKCEIP